MPHRRAATTPPPANARIYAAMVNAKRIVGNMLDCPKLIIAKVNWRQSPWTPVFVSKR
jgi:hypothetical protein